jgi:indolepyruvate ferredoxin oxidoreductase
MTVAAPPFTLDAKYDVEDGEVLLTGVQALVRLLFDQLRADRRRGLRTAALVSGYQGSPLGTFDLTLQRSSRRLREALDVHWIAGVNEELAATAVWGSQQDALGPLARHDGVIGMWYGKAPGLDRSGDAMRHANLHGVGRLGGVLCAVGDDPQAKSSTFPTASEHALRDLGMPVYAPGSPQDIVDLGLHAYALSRYSGLWAAMKIVTVVADGLSTVKVHPERLWARPALTFDGTRWEHRQGRFFLPDTIAMERELFTRRFEAARSFADLNRVHHVEVEPGSPRVTIVAGGHSYLEVREALATLGLEDGPAIAAAGIRLLRLGLISPLSATMIADAATGVRDLVVVEEKRSFVEAQLREALYGATEQPRIWGKRGPTGAVLFPEDGDLPANRLVAPLYRVLRDCVDQPERLWAPRERLPLAPLTAPRAPMFCSGCPHSRSTIETSGSRVGAGVGCHAMVLWLDRGADSYTQMGGEGAHWVGRAPFTDVPHLVQNVGDGTFFHSASLVIRQAVSAGTTMTFKLLYNGVVAMTGGQDPAGMLDVPHLCRMLVAEGVSRVAVVAEDARAYGRVAWPAHTTVHGRQELAEVEAELSRTVGVSVLVFDQACAAELRRLRKRGQAPVRSTRVVINELVCEGCGDCGTKSNCLSVQPVDTAFGRKTQIDQTSCNTDYSCLDGDCPSFITLQSGPDHRERPVRPVSLPALPEPDRPPVRGPSGYGILLTGIGGTGVVTVNQVLATAAVLDGVNVRGQDQTGLAQKGGAVVSHLRILPGEIDVSSAVGDEGADVLLAFDPLVAVDPANLARTAASRTSTIAAAGIVPTSEMVRDPDVQAPGVEDLLGVLRSHTRASRLFTIDAGGLAEALLGDTTSANMIILGAAYQVGALPLAASSIARAIELNGVAVEQNHTAFAIGRAAIADPSALPKARRRGAIDRCPAPRSLELAGRLVAERGLRGDLLAGRAAELIEYQDLRLAHRFVRLLGDVRQAATNAGLDPTDLVEDVAAGFFHLLAYKDEYEVARLHLLPEAQRSVRAAVPQGRRLRYVLQPPLLRALGLQRKIHVPPALAHPAFRMLRSMRRVRGTWADPFGHMRIRRLERHLADQFEADVRELLGQLDAANVAQVSKLARLPLMIRGYESLKLASAARHAQERARLRSSLDVS